MKTADLAEWQQQLAEISASRNERPPGPVVVELWALAQEIRQAAEAGDQVALDLADRAETLARATWWTAAEQMLAALNF
jgi:hypothetical protein